MTNANTALAVFKFETNEVRTVIKGGEPWFVASDVCAALAYAHVPHALRVLDDDEKGTHKASTLGGEQSLAVINESGLYSLILKSRKAEAKRFKKWVTSEVLPSIRKTGKYDVRTASGPLTKEMRQAIKNLVVERAKVLPAEKQAGAIIKAWSALKSHFGVSYKEIPCDKYAEALSLVARMQVEWELVEPDALPAPAKPSYHYPLSAADPKGRFCGNAFLTPAVLLSEENRPLELELIAQLEADGHDVTGAKIRIQAMRDQLYYIEQTRGRMALWESQLNKVAREIGFHQQERGKNVIFSRPPNRNDPIEQHVYRDQL